MESLSCPKSLFLEIEPFIKEYYGVDRNAIKQIIYDSVSITDFNDADKVNGKIIITPDNSLEKADKLHIKIYDNCQYEKVKDLCAEYGIEPNTFEYNVLTFMSLVPDVNYGEPTELDNLMEDTWRYEQDVRPEMLKLYIALHDECNKAWKDTRISFGHSQTLSLDIMTPWLQGAIDDYLQIYLGVKDLEEAKEEYEVIYNNGKSKKHLDVRTASFMWGTYHLLQRVRNMNYNDGSPKVREQSRFVKDYLYALGMIPDIFLDSESIRGRINYLLSHFKSFEEINKKKIYKMSPNNKSTDKLF